MDILYVSLLLVQDLRVVCGEYMKQHVVSAAEHNHLLGWLQYCMASQHTAVAAACLNHFKWNFEQVIACSLTLCSRHLYCTIVGIALLDAAANVTTRLYWVTRKCLSVSN